MNSLLLPFSWGFFDSDRHEKSEKSFPQELFSKEKKKKKERSDCKVEQEGSRQQYILFYIQPTLFALLFLLHSVRCLGNSRLIEAWYFVLLGLFSFKLCQTSHLKKQNKYHNVFSQLGTSKIKGNTQEPKLKRSFEILRVLYEKISVFYIN